MSAFLLAACATQEPGVTPSGELDCAPNTHVEEGACVLDPPDAEDSGGAAVASLQTINHTDAGWVELWLCDAAECSSRIDGVGNLADAGESATFELVADQEYSATVVDEAGRCTATPWFSVGADDVWVWEVVDYVGVWSDADPFGCVSG